MKENCLRLVFNTILDRDDNLKICIGIGLIVDGQECLLLVKLKEKKNEFPDEVYPLINNPEGINKGDSQESEVSTKDKPIATEKI